MPNTESDRFDPMEVALNPSLSDKAAQRGFDVVLLKDKVSPAEAKPEDFQRITVSAVDRFRALEDPKVTEATKSGWVPIGAAPAGSQVDVEMAAGARFRSSLPPIDKAKI